MPQFSDDLFLGSSQTFMGTGNTSIGSIFTGSVSSTTMTVTAMQSGDPIVLGQFVEGTGVTDGSYITAFGTGTGGVGTYTVSASSSATGSITITANGNALLSDPSQMDLGVGPLGRIYVWDTVPQVKATNNIATASVYTSTVTLTAGTGVKSVTRLTGLTALQLDVPRAVSVTTGAGSPTTRNVTISGFDYYGQPMSEVIATGAVASTTTNGKKAFYQIGGITISGSPVVTVAVGTTDILGIPVRVSSVTYVSSVKQGTTLAQDAGTFVAADMTSTATTTTGDVRGTYAPSAANDGIKRLVMGVLLPAIAVGPNSTRIGALGVTQA
jgi:hypothetical protein